MKVLVRELGVALEIALQVPKGLVDVEFGTFTGLYFFSSASIESALASTSSS